MELPNPPQGWSLKSLIEIDEQQWSAQLWHQEHYVYGYGTSARYSMLDALRRIENGDVYDKCSGFSKSSEDRKTRLSVEKLIASLKPAEKKVELDRRF